MKKMLGVSKDGDGIELSLELSIGGCYKEIEKKPLKESEKLHDENNNIINNNNNVSDVSEAFVGHVKDEENGLDQQRKRDFHALRRQEARRKKAEKQKRLVESSKEKINLFEAQKFQARVEDRDKKENEKKIEEFVRKSNGYHVQDLNVSVNPSSEKSTMMSNVTVQYKPHVNGGFANPFSGNQSGGKDMGDEKNLKNLFQPVACRSFRPYQNGDLSRASSVGFDLNHKNGGKCGPGNQKAVSNGSLERSSSAFSDYQSTSQKGGSCSTDTGSHSNYSQGCQQQLSASATSAILERSDINGTSSQITSHQANPKTTNFNAKPASSNISTPERPDPKKPDPVNNLTSMPQEPTSSSSKGSSEVATKPPNPQTNDQRTNPLRQMPFVSTTGNGPNGKTINGFLYRYSKTEVCIVCVCHGSSFSPAEFVEHAGGVDISHPLRHITIVSASFG